MRAVGGAEPDHGAGFGPALAAPLVTPMPTELPELRSQLVEYICSEACHGERDPGIDQGLERMCPLVDTTQDPSHRAAYYATGDMTALSLASAATARSGVVSRSRLPSPSEFMLFCEPIANQDPMRRRVLFGHKKWRREDWVLTCRVRSR